jgi:hypothetical protein
MPSFSKQHSEQKHSYESLASTWHENYFLTSNIYTGTTPQWDRTNTQCKIWLRTLCTTGLGLSDDEAETIAKDFLGFGPNLYLMKLDEWKELSGETRGKGCLLVVVEYKAFDGSEACGDFA